MNHNLLIRLICNILALAICGWALTTGRHTDSTMMAGTAIVLMLTVVGWRS